MNPIEDGQTAAIVCIEVARGSSPILYAERTEADDPADSGWQFLCGIESEDLAAAQIWALHEVVEVDPSLLTFVGLPVGTALKRSRGSHGWTIERNGSADSKSEP
jgi:hypothetical protein